MSVDVRRRVADAIATSEPAFGSVHGGVLTTVMDISMGHLCHRFLSTAVTIEMQMRFFRPVTGDCRAEGRLT